jgi:DNA helicase HerA-like ATPase
MTEAETRRLGIVVSGSLNKGVEVRLDGATSLEDMAVGRYVTIEGKKQRFFGMITDISLGVTDAQLTLNPPDTTNSFIAEVLNGTGTYGMLHVTPYLTMNTVAGTEEQAMPVKTVPSHFSDVLLANERDIDIVFGKEGLERFYIGNPLDMESKLCLNLEEFVKRSNGIFGKSGTGKTFFTRILLAGMVQKSKAVNLIFDMQNEYGWKGRGEEISEVKGLKQLFPAKVAVFTIDEEHAKRRGVSTDFVVKIGCDEIQPDDMVSLRQTLNLTDQAVGAIYQLYRKYERHWIEKTFALKDEELTNTIDELKIHESTLQNLQRGLAKIKNLPFVVSHSPTNAVTTILQYLASEKNVVLEFGRHRDITTYVFVANMLSRRIYDQYQYLCDVSMGDKAKEPTNLVITIEEAHKFLNSEVANQTIFGTIAREMRKYNVSLLVIDQRPSGIDEEVMSQLGTKIAFLLDNDRDVDSVFSGVSGKDALKSVLSRLAAKRQALIFGHSLPMPVAFVPREWGSAASYRDFGQSEDTKKDIEDLW